MDSHEQDIKYIQEWMRKAAHLPEPFNERLILRFLHSTYYSLEQTKACIERFCNSRHYMPHVYTKRDPLSASMKTVNSLDAIAMYHCGDMCTLFMRVGNDVGRFILNETIKGISLKIDFWLETDSRLTDVDVVVYDFINVSIKHATKVNPFVLKEHILYLLKSGPVRINKVFLINANACTEFLLNMVKPVLPTELIKNIVVSPNDKCLHEFIDKKFLPSDYGGEAPSLNDTSDKMNKIISNQYRDMFLDDNLWKGDLTMIPKTEEVVNLKGSFRTLNID